MWRERAALLAVIGFAAATVIDLLVAFGSVDVGREPGESTLLENAAGASSFFAFLIAIAAALRPSRRWPIVLLPAVAAAFMVAHYYTFDSYFYPAHLRYSEAGSVAGWWLILVAAVGLVVAAAVRASAHAALAIPPFLVVCGLTTVAQGIGH